MTPQEENELRASFRRDLEGRYPYDGPQGRIALQIDEDIFIDYVRAARKENIADRTSTSPNILKQLFASPLDRLSKLFPSTR